MKNKNLLLVGGIVVVLVVSTIFVLRPAANKKQSLNKIRSAATMKKASAAVNVSQKGSKSAMPPAPVKKAISKDMGAVTVKMMGSKNSPIYSRINAYKALDSKNSLFSKSFMANTSIELSPGNYDIVIDTTPARIYKNIKISQAQETVEDLGVVSGALRVKVSDGKGSPEYCGIRIAHAGSSEMVTSSNANTIVELLPGNYDIELGTTPKEYKKDVKVEAGKENLVDLGCIAGTLIVKVASSNSGKITRYIIFVKKSSDNTVVATIATDSPTKLLKGNYSVAVMNDPSKTKKDITIEAGKESVVEFTI